ncbi:hypothetical protein NONO_c04680 [Nocardia nova SH22a]|uniref:DUF4232 domain-containing protein n=1 Tax=Nocardia nova SH22a TaxID=1415166 RepID=W5TDG3_9NOCA|nr:DUF4232 domain-containing protein [Nocardia nova]AHH15281.1 hypothetical protein NONO_c04680 [Nocardia nova SH22a]
MLEPNGPLPPEIYWRRRLLAIGALVVALALVIWLAMMLLRGGGDNKDTKHAGAAATSTSAAATGTGNPSSAKPAAPGTSASGTVNSTANGTPAQCPDQSLAVKSNVGQPTYKAGEQPVFTVVITNISTAACTRDMGSGLQQVWVQSLDGQRRLWSSTDCDQGGPADVRTLNGGQQAAFTLTWSATTSQPGCEGDRVPVPAGGYAVVAQFGSVRSTPETFNIA